MNASDPPPTTCSVCACAILQDLLVLTDLTTTLTLSVTKANSGSFAVAIL